MGNSKVTCSRCGMKIKEEDSYKLIMERAERNPLALSPLLDITYRRIGEVTLCGKCQNFISVTERTMIPPARKENQEFYYRAMKRMEKAGYENLAEKDIIAKMEEMLEKINKKGTVEEISVQYICDGRACPECKGPLGTCAYTQDVRHAENFIFKNGIMTEKKERKN